MKNVYSQAVAKTSLIKIMHGFYIVCLIAIIKISESNKRPNILKDAFSQPKPESRDTFRLPVPFGHVYQEGFGDIGGLKAPIDYLDLTIRHPMNSEEAREALKNSKPENIQFLEPYIHARGFTNPRDKVFKDLGISFTGPEINETQFRWFNLADLQQRNVDGRPFPKHVFRESYPPQPEEDRRVSALRKELIDDSFDPRNEQIVNNPNVTTCDEFGSRAYFYPKDIVNLNWVPFYVWSLETTSTIARIQTFKYATKKLVNSVRELYRKFIKIDWQQPKLLHDGLVQYLLIAADRRGLFHALQVMDTSPDKVVGSIPYIKLRLKIQDPYLVMMYCTDFHATVMAVVGNEPKTDQEKQEEADTIGIKGPGYPVSRDLAAEEKEEKIRRESELRNQKSNTDSDVPPKPNAQENNE